MSDATADKVPSPLIERGRAWRALIDALVLASALGGLNFFVSRQDPGWLSVNPSPWLLLPLFLGGRYGALTGLGGAALAGACILGLRYGVLAELPRAALQGSPHLFTGLILTAAAAAVIHVLLQNALRPTRKQLHEMKEENRRLHSDVTIYQENEANLLEALLLHGADYTSLKDDAERLLETHPDNVAAGFLALAERYFSVTGAAIYQSDNGGRLLTRQSVNGNPELFPSETSPESLPMIAAAVRSGKLVTCRHLWEDVPLESSPYLAIVSWRNREQPRYRACLFVARMPLDRITWENLARLETLFGWFMEAGGLPHPARSQPREPDTTATTPAATPSAPSAGAAASPPEPASAGSPSEKPEPEPAGAEPAPPHQPAAPSPAGALSPVEPPNVFQQSLATALQDRERRVATLVVFETATNAPESLKNDFLHALRRAAAEHGRLGALASPTGKGYLIAMLRYGAGAEEAARMAEVIITSLPGGQTFIRYRAVPVEPGGEFERYWLKRDSVVSAPSSASAGASSTNE